jgi:hypothetical protein
MLRSSDWEYLMIAIDNLTISTRAGSGTTVGNLSLFSASMGQMPNVNFILTKNAAGFFGISGSKVVTMNTPIPPGLYSVKVRAVGTRAWMDDDAQFTITVTN